MGLCNLVCQEIEKSLANSSSKNSLCLTGGRTAAAIYSNKKIQKILSEKIITDYYFGDDRCVPPDHPESNYQLARTTLFESGVPDGTKLHRMQGELSDLDAEADRYANLLPDWLDLLLLSVGEDGHIASLFPSHLALRENKKKILVVRDAPKFPPKRLTITPVVVRNAKNTIVMATGAQKGRVLAEALKNPENISELPVRLTIGATWVLDDCAVSAFNKIKPSDLLRTRVVSR